MSAIDDAVLLKMAEAEILGEAKRAAVRHSTAGISGWQPCPKTNKMFLTNTLLQTMSSNKHLSKKKGKNKKHEKTERKLLQRKSKTDMTSNFIYQKPQRREKSLLNTKSSKNSISDLKSVDVQSENNKDFKKISLKKFGKVKKNVNT